MLEIKDLKVVFNQNTVNEKVALEGVNLRLYPGDFVTVIGSNGAGKSTLLGAIAGDVEADGGRIYNKGRDITYEPVHRRARYIGRLYQDPLKGTAPNMSIEENLGLAFARGKKPRFGFAVRKTERKLFKEVCAALGLGLESRMKSPVGLLSGGQRQALTLLMATLEAPELLLLDEHTAALDPKTALQILEITKDIVERNKISTLMITHNIQNALDYGNKTLVMSRGRIIRLLEGEERASMKIEDIMKLYADQGELLSDRSLLA